MADGGNGYLEKVAPLLEGFKVRDKSTGTEIKIFEHGRTKLKLGAYPDYVIEASYQGLQNPTMSDSHYKVVLDKWGRKDSKTKRYIETPEMVFYRAALSVAEGLTRNDSTVDLEMITKEVFQKFVNREMFPNTPYMANAGHKSIARDLTQRLAECGDAGLLNDIRQEGTVKEQLFACFVLDIYDSRESIFDTMKDAAKIQASIGGTGFNFSNLRPANESIHGTGGTTDGPVAFMGMYSVVLGKTMNQGGKREGANMFMLDWNHPDIMRFIYCKRQDGEIAAANISIAEDHPFWAAARAEGEERFYRLKNPHFNPKLRPHITEYYSEEQLRESLDVTKMNKKAKVSLLIGENGVDVLSPWVPEGLDDSYTVIGKIKEGEVYLDAKKVLRHLSYGAWFNGEPGVINTGHINDGNPTLPRYFKEYILEKRDSEALEIIGRLRQAKKNVPLEKLVDEFITERDDEGHFVNLPIGVGEMRATNPCGEKPLLGNEACALGHTNLEKILVKDPSQSSGYRVDYEAFKSNVRLMYEILDNSIDQNEFTNKNIERTQKSNRKIGMGFMGLANMLYRLEIPYNSSETREFVDTLLAFWEKESDEASHEKAEKFGAFPNFKYSKFRNGRPKRNAIVRTLAPTGTTGFAAQTTGGMEPEYALAYTRTTVQGTTVDVFNPVLEEKLQKYPFFFDDAEKRRFHTYVQDPNGGDGSLQGFTLVKGAGEQDDRFGMRQKHLDKIKNIFVTTYDISPEDHLRMEAVVQNHVDDAISKTTNFRSNVGVEDVEKAFLLADELKIKGVTFYRNGTRKDQPLKVKGGFTKEEINPIENLRQKRQDLATLVAQRLAEPRPEIVGGLTEKQRTPYGLNVFVGLNWEKDEYGKDIAPYEVFVSVPNTEGDLPGIAAGYGKAITLGLKAGVPVEAYIEQFQKITGETQVGIGEHKVTSFPHAIAKGLESVLRKEARINNGNGHNITQTPTIKIKGEGKVTGKFCPSCSLPLRIAEGCEQCSCGFSKCN
ncbi:MAG: ribonucleotide reductase N-terminal alpha domain-containing protein [bacterium]|nr:ribonucleotide reductase N-terminal alpha domain-containing protein [bacterium]